MAATLASWLFLYLALLAAFVVGGAVLRAATGRRWSNRALLRAGSALGFVAATLLWLGIGAITR